MTSFSDVVKAVGWVTFRELVRDKILYNILLVALLLLGMAFLASKLTYVRPERIILDFGLAAVQISMAMVAIFTGSAMVGREFDRRTIFVALSRPISRHRFIAGKFAGLSLVLLANWALLVAAYILILQVVAPLSATWSVTLGYALLLVIPQSIMIAALAILFSTFTTTSLAAAFTIGLYLVGSNVSQFRLIAAKSDHPVNQFVMNALGSGFPLPDLEKFNLGLKVTYGLPVAPITLAIGFGYAMVVCAACLMLAGHFARNRES